MSASIMRATVADAIGKLTFISRKVLFMETNELLNLGSRSDSIICV
jgi:hypothetical protein